MPGLPIVPADESDRGRGSKRSREPQQLRSAAGSGAVGRPKAWAGLPGVEEHGRRVSFLHRGCHEGGEGVVPPALQEALGNMSFVLSQEFCVDRASQFLKGRRKDRRFNIAKFLASVCPGTCPKHISTVDAMIAHLCGMQPRTVQCTLLAMRKRGGQAARPRGAGGRPRQSDRPVGRDESAEGSGPGDLGESLPEVAPLEQEWPVVQPSSNIEKDVRQIGLRLGALVACLGSMSD